MFDPTSNNANAEFDARWWWENPELDEKANRNRRGQSLANISMQLYRVQEPVRTNFAVCARLYTNQPIIGLTPRTYRQRSPGIKFNAPGLNVVKAVCDAYVSLITHDRPKTFFDVAGGDWELKRKAHHLQMFMDGLAYETELEQKAPDIVMDTAIFGLGVVKIYADYDNEKKPRIRIERVLPWEVLVDDQEAVYGSPDNIYQYKYVDRKVLMDQYPEYVNEIRLANNSVFADAPGSTYVNGTFCDMLVVVEAWHKARVPGSAEEGGSVDGRHTKIVGSTVIEDEVYTWDRFPFEFCYRQKPIQGVWGISLPGELMPTQLEINRMMRTISQSQRLAVGHWLAERNADVDTNAINNVVASIIRYTGNPPTYVSFQAVSQEVYSYLWALWAKGFESTGVSEMAAMSQVPQGIKSGKAIDTYADVQSDRFKPAYRNYEHWFIRITEQVIHWAREIMEIYPDFEVKAPGSKTMMKTVKWADVHLKDEEFQLKLKPANMLGDDVAERFQMVEDMVGAGFIDPITAKRLMVENGIPDIEGEISLEMAAFNLTMCCATDIADHGIYSPPDAMLADQIPLMINVVRMFYLKAVQCKLAPDRLRMLREWMQQAASLVPPPLPPVPPQLPAGGPGLLPSGRGPGNAPPGA
jgi:hypothetical protein